METAQQPIRDTDIRYARLKVPKLGEVKVRLSRPLQGDPAAETNNEVTSEEVYDWICIIDELKTDLAQIDAALKTMPDLCWSHSC